MKINPLLIAIAICFLLISGCVPKGSSPKKSDRGEGSVLASETEKGTPLQQYLARGESFEKEGLFSSALEQYKLALTIAPQNRQAIRNKNRVLTKLHEKADAHYKKGLAFDKSGQYKSARKEYLSALQNWPDHKAAKNRLTPGGVSDDTREYITHTLKYGESVSKVSLIYYGDLKKHDIIGKFNVLDDVTKVHVGEKLKIPVIEGVTLLDLQQKHTDYLKTVGKKDTSPETVAEPDQMAEPDLTSEPDLTPEPDAVAESDILEESFPVIDSDMANETDAIAEQEQEMVEPEEKSVTEIESVPEKYIPEEDPARQTEPLIEKETVEIKNPSNDALVKEALEKKAAVLYDQGVEQFNNKKYDKAIPLFQEAIATDPGNEMFLDYLFQSHFQNGLTFFKSKKYLDARDDFQSALDYRDSCEKCQDYIEKSETMYKEKHYNLGIHYFGKENLEKAIVEWKQVKALDPEYKEVTPNLKKAETLLKRLESIKKSTTP